MTPQNHKSTDASWGKFFCLDCLRGIAIVWIVCYHILAYESRNYPPVLYHLIQNGYLGVDLFLIISGFGITKAAQRVIRNEESYGYFILRRLGRIYVPY